MIDNRRSRGIDDLERLLRQFDTRLRRQEARYIGHKHPEAYTGVATAADLPSEPQPGDLALDIATDTVYTADAGGNWQVGGAIQP